MAIMGFGRGAFSASPLSVWLMSKFSTPTHVGVFGAVQTYEHVSADGSAEYRPAALLRPNV
jgi:hypothetical protein